MPHVSVINESALAGDTEIETIARAFNKQWNVDLRPVWGLDSATFEIVPPARTPPTGSWWVVFLDDSAHAHKRAYHDLTNEGLPIAKVFVKVIRADKASLSVGATHEVCEMAVDPWVNNAYQDSRGNFWAGEICDPVEDETYGYRIDGTLVTDFVTPDWFAPLHASGTVDFKRRARKPFEVLPGGYCQKFDPRKGWVQITGDAVRHSKQAVAARGTRRERRMRDAASWKRSALDWGGEARAQRRSQAK